MSGQLTSASLLKHHKHAVRPTKSPNLIEKQKRITLFFLLNASFFFSTSPAAVTTDTGLYDVCSVVTATSLENKGKDMKKDVIT